VFEEYFLNVSQGLICFTLGTHRS